MNAEKPNEEPEPTGYLTGRVITEILRKDDEELEMIRENAIEECVAL
jgi:hypothetical protein